MYNLYDCYARNSTEQSTLYIYIYIHIYLCFVMKHFIIYRKSSAQVKNPELHLTVSCAEVQVDCMLNFV